jgi:hypothetical protein
MPPPRINYLAEDSQLRQINIWSWVIQQNGTEPKHIRVKEGNSIISSVLCSCPWSGKVDVATVGYVRTGARGLAIAAVNRIYTRRGESAGTVTLTERIKLDKRRESETHWKERRKDNINQSRYKHAGTIHTRCFPEAFGFR